jgi:hypothetical protein
MFLTIVDRAAINLDHVRKITWRRPNRETVFHYTDCEREVATGIHEPPGLVIPAAPGFLLALAYPPFEEDIGCEAEAYDFSSCISLYAIIGWKIEDDLSPIPFTVHGCEEWVSCRHAAIVEPSGRVVIPLDQDFCNVAEWTNAVRATWLSKKKTPALEQQQA